MGDKRPFLTLAAELAGIAGLAVTGWSLLSPARPAAGSKETNDRTEAASAASIDQTKDRTTAPTPSSFAAPAQSVERVIIERQLQVPAETPAAPRAAEARTVSPTAASSPQAEVRLAPSHICQHKAISVSFETSGSDYRYYRGQDGTKILSIEQCDAGSGRFTLEQDGFPATQGRALGTALQFSFFGGRSDYTFECRVEADLRVARLPLDESCAASTATTFAQDRREWR